MKRLATHIAHVVKSLLLRIWCKHGDTRIASCPFTGFTYTTCTRCMKTFANKHNKSRHIKMNNCKPRSIFVYLKEKQERLAKQALEKELEIQSKSIEQTTENTGEASEINCNNHNNIIQYWDCT